MIAKPSRGVPGAVRAAKKRPQCGGRLEPSYKGLCAVAKGMTLFKARWQVHIVVVTAAYFIANSSISFLSSLLSRSKLRLTRFAIDPLSAFSCGTGL
jgi:hypothetical protein